MTTGSRRTLTSSSGRSRARSALSISSPSVPYLVCVPLSSLCPPPFLLLWLLISFSSSMPLVRSQSDKFSSEIDQYGYACNESDIEWNTPLANNSQQDEKRRNIVLPKATNISVILINWFPPAVRIHWDYPRAEVRNLHLQAFQIVYHPVRSRYRIIQEVPPYFKNLTLDRLQSGTEYSLIINALADTGESNQSRLVNFISPDNETRRSHRKFINRPIHTYPDELQEGLKVREDEVVIVVLVIIAWIGCIFVFFNKWGKIRMLEPYQPQYKETFDDSLQSLHPKPTRMNTCTSVPPNMISIDSRGSLIGDRELLMHQHRLTESGGQLYQCASGSSYHHPAYRPRLNSVFVGTPFGHRDSLFPDHPNMPRKVKSAEDLKSLVVQVSTDHHNVPSTSTSVL